MIPFPNIDPVIFGIGPLQVRWYGLMYILGFAACYFLVQKQIRHHNCRDLAPHFENLNLLLILSVVVGGRLGYVLFYNLEYYLHHPLEILATWEGGMSFHGACLLVIMSGWFFTRRYEINFWRAIDLYIVTIPIGLGLGRLGNFINGELYGRATDLPWGMVFPGGGPIPRHPSQLYEMILEGPVLFLILWSLKERPWQAASSWGHGRLLALFLLGYGSFRFLIEFAREPDQQIGLFLETISMGQILSGLMIAAGALIWFTRTRDQPTQLIKP